MPGTFGRAFVALSLLASSTAYGRPYQPPPMPPGYDNPGPKPVNVLPQIIAKLRGELRDPYSIRDFILCEPSASAPMKPFSKRIQWQPAKWTVLFALNAKNAYGGYAGREPWRASFAGGSVERVASAKFSNSSSIDVTINQLTEKLLEKCQRVPDAEIQRLLAS